MSRIRRKEGREERKKEGRREKIEGREKGKEGIKINKQNSEPLEL